MKACTVCGAEKPLDQFYRSKRSRDGRSYRCAECDRAAQYAWRAAAPDKWAANVARVRERHGDRFKAERKARYERDKAAGLPDAVKLAYHADAAAQRRRVAEYRRRNPEKVAAYNRKYRKENPEKVRGFCRARRARELGAEGSHTAEQVKELFAKQKGRCACCRERLTAYHVDHIIALARGGSDYIENIQLLCKSCNSRKNAKCPVQFMQEQGFLL